MPNWQNVLSVDEKITQSKELDRSKAAEYLGESEEVIAELEECCNVSTLVCSAEKELGDLDFVSLKDGIPVKDVFLESLRVRCMAFKRSQGVPSQFYVAPKYAKGNYEMEYSHLKSGVQKDSPLDRVQDPKALLQVIIFKPYRGFVGTIESWRDRDVWKERELLVLSGMKLTELKDKLLCAADEALVSPDLSEDPNAEGLEKAGDKYPSNFFFIENTFYLDQRNPLATDISSPIRDWLNAKNDQDTGFVSSEISVKPMSEVTFDDLRIRLGYPYLYCHQGYCEHLVVFSDVRLMHGDDCQDLSKYPIMINKPPKKKVVCMICRVFTSKWMTRNDSFTPSEPSYQCDTCFRMLHYDEDGKKLGSFEAYPYMDAAIFS